MESLKLWNYDLGGIMSCSCIQIDVGYSYSLLCIGSYKVAIMCIIKNGRKLFEALKLQSGYTFLEYPV